MKNFSIGFLFTLLTIVVCGQSIQITEDSLQKYFNTNKENRDPIEGLWDVVSTHEYYRFDTLYDVVKQPNATKVVVLKKENKCQTFYLSGESFDVEFSTTDVKGVYLYRNFFFLSNQYSESHAVINKSGIIEYTYDLPEGDIRIKSGNKYKQGMRVVNVLKWTKVF